MDAAAVIARLRADRPLFHSISEEGSRAVAALGFLPAGDCRATLATTAYRRGCGGGEGAALGPTAAEPVVI